MIFFIFVFLNILIFSRQEDCNCDSCFECVLDPKCYFLDSSYSCVSSYVSRSKFSEMVDRLESCKNNIIISEENPHCPEASFTLKDEETTLIISPHELDGQYYSEYNYCYYNFNIKELKQLSRDVCFEITNYATEDNNPPQSLLIWYIPLVII